MGEGTSQILVAVDYSETSERALEHAFRMVRADPQARLHVMTVVELGELLDGNRADPSDDTDDRRKLDAFVEKVARREAMGTSIETHVVSGEPARAIVVLARKIDADLIVVGTHGHGTLKRFFLGSVAEQVVRLAGCPVLVVRSKNHDI